MKRIESMLGLIMTPEVINGLFAISGAIIGAVLAGLFSIKIAKSSKDKKQLTLSKSFVSRLLVVHEKYNEKIKITAHDEEIDNLLLSELNISNTGNMVVDKIALNAKCGIESKILSAEAINQQSESVLEGAVIDVSSDNELSLNVDYINAGEEISIRVLLTGDDPVWKMHLRQPGLDVVVKEQPVSSYSDVMTIAFVEVFKHSGLHRLMMLTNPPYKKIVKNVSDRLDRDS